MRSRRLTALAALLAGQLACLGAGITSVAAADEADSNAAGQSQAQSASAAMLAPPPKSGTAEPAKTLVEPTDTLLVYGGGLLIVALAAIGLTITFHSLLGDLRKRRNRYRRRTQRETRGN